MAVEAPPGLPSVHADPEQVAPVLAYLLGNAVKYSPEGGPIRVGARPSGGCVEVAVTNGGLGLPPDEVGRLFEPFYRVDGAERVGIAGTGLGLAICRRIVEAHGGTIRAESDGPGSGTTVRFTLPLTAPPAR